MLVNVESYRGAKIVMATVRDLIFITKWHHPRNKRRIMIDNRIFLGLADFNDLNLFDVRLK